MESLDGLSSRSKSQKADSPSQIKKKRYTPKRQESRIMNKAEKMGISKFAGSRGDETDPRALESRQPMSLFS